MGEAEAEVALKANSQETAAPRAALEDGSDTDSMADVHVVEMSEVAEVQSAPPDAAKLALQDMGFADSALNAALLATNGGDLQSTAVQLLQLSEWSEQRTALLEMGVEDSVQLAQLLLKHNGNANLVVKELLSN